MLKLSIETIVAVCVPLLSLLIAALALRRNNKQDTSADARERAMLTADVRYIRNSIDEIKLENKSIQKDMGELKQKVVEIEQSTKSAHKRLDDMRKEHES